MKNVFCEENYRIFEASLFLNPKFCQTKEYVQLNAGITLADNLVALKGRGVTVTLSSGQAVTGIVKDVQNNRLHLEKISQKEFYDAVISIDHVSAIEARVR